MQLLMSPFRFAGQWALFPLLLVCAGLVGATAGGMSAWAASRPEVEPSRMLGLVASPLSWIVATVLLGLATNSWAISTLVGATTMTAASVADAIAHGFLHDGISVDHIEVVRVLPLAILAGGSLGWAGCLWWHERGWFRMLGATLIAGSFLSVAWPELEPVGFTFGLDHLVGWIAVGVAGLVILRAGGIGAIIVATIGSVVVALGVLLISGDATFSPGSLLGDFWQDVYRRGRDLIGVR